MTATTTLSPRKLWTLIGGPACPVIIDGRTEDDITADPRLIPTAVLRPGLEAATWATDYAGTATVVYCERGLKISEGAAAWLRHAGARAQVLEDGFQGWRAAGLPLLPVADLPPRDADGLRRWVTAEDPALEALAAAWLIRRFVDAKAVILFVASSQVAAVAERFAARPFACTAQANPKGADAGAFGTMIDAFSLRCESLERLAAVLRNDHGVRPAEAAGLQAIGRGLAALHRDDLARLEAAMAVFDALYRWACQGAAGKEEG